jgi:protein SCO1/2
MTSRRILLAASVVAALAAVTAGCSGGGSSSSGSTMESTGQVQINPSKYKGDIITPVAKPTIVLTDASGAPYDIRTMTAGTVTLLYFGYTNCPNECPLTMANTAAALRMLPAAEQAKVRVLFITVDPARDTLARLRSWLGNFNPSFIGLRGTLSQIQAAAQQTGIPVGTPIKGPDGTYALDHGTEMLAYSTDNLAHESFFPSTPPVSIAHDLALLVTGHHP